MRYLSIDIETTGIDPKETDIIEFGAVIDDTEHPEIPVADLPQFHRYVLKASGKYRGELVPLSWHAEIFRRMNIAADAMEKGLRSEYPACYQEDLGHDLSVFLAENDVSGKITPAGKNFSSFDLSFLLEVPAFEKYVSLERRSARTKVSIAKRAIDPAVLFYRSGDILLPDTKQCLERAGIDITAKHTALEDAMIVVRLVREGFRQRKLVGK